MNNLHELLTACSINPSDAPEIWNEEWDAVSLAYQHSRKDLFTDSYMQYANELFCLSTDKLQVFRNTARLIYESESLCMLAWLWYYTVFEGKMKEEHVMVDKWPTPQNMPKKLSGVFLAMVLMYALQPLERFYDNKGISREILISTLSDIDVNMKLNPDGLYLFSNYWFNWLQNHFKGNLFRIGRLQFKCSEFADDKCIYENKSTGELKVTHLGDLDEYKNVPDEWELVIKKGDMRLEVHISEGSPMMPEECQKSYRGAAELYVNKFGKDIKGYTCASWLISPDLKSLLPPNSNIIRFQEDYFMYEYLDCETYFGAIYGWWLDEGTPVDDLPEDTSLQRAIKKHKQAGGNVYSACGFKKIANHAVDALA